MDFLTQQKILKDLHQQENLQLRKESINKQFFN